MDKAAGWETTVDRPPAAPRGRCHLSQRLARFGRNPAGNVSIEFGFLILLFVLLAVGAVDFGLLGLQKIAVTNAARSGAQYGMQDFMTAGDVAGMVQAAREDAGDTTESLDITARQFCTCPVEGEIVCTTTCSDGSFPMMYVDVTVQNEMPLLLPYPGIESPRLITSNSRMRVR